MNGSRRRRSQQHTYSVSTSRGLFRSEKRETLQLKKENNLRPNFSLSNRYRSNADRRVFLTYCVLLFSPEGTSSSLSKHTSFPQDEHQYQPEKPIRTCYVPRWLPLKECGTLPTDRPFLARSEPAKCQFYRRCQNKMFTLGDRIPEREREGRRMNLFGSRDDDESGNSGVSFQSGGRGGLQGVSRSD